MIQHRVSVVENVRIAERTYRLRVADPEIGSGLMPGQFVMLRIPESTDPLLGRPFALYDTCLDKSGFVAGYDLVYLVVGNITTRMSHLAAGDSVEVWGPLGNGFSLTPTRHLLMVAGGIGQTPFPAVARAYLGLRQYGASDAEDRAGSRQSAVGSSESEERAGFVPTADCQRPTVPLRLATRVGLCYGVRGAAYLAGADDFRELGVEVALATDDGSAGHHGIVTDLAKRALASDDPPTLLMGCGPEPMMHSLAQIADTAGVPCQLSLETPMACGIGACFSCVAKIRQENGHWDYRRVCVEGPVFDASQVVFL
jgi:dihydroorotate dehydrogenase electron transfer subunit